MSRLGEKARSLRLFVVRGGANSAHSSPNAVLMRARAGTREVSARPTAELSAAALELVERHAGQIMATARRYAATAEDAEDAYQRGLEIMLTKAPSTAEDQLVPWLKTVVKHEAFALRRQRDRHTPTGDDGDAPERPGGTARARAGGAPRAAAARRRGAAAAEAAGDPRADPARRGPLVRRDRARSATGRTRRSTAACPRAGARSSSASTASRAATSAQRLAPHLSALADGEATAEDMKALRPHLRTCLACRAQLREFRAAPGPGGRAHAAGGAGGHLGRRAARCGPAWSRWRRA